MFVLSERCTINNYDKAQKINLGDINKIYQLLKVYF